MITNGIGANSLLPLSLERFLYAFPQEIERKHREEDGHPRKYQKVRVEPKRQPSLVGKASPACKGRLNSQP